jgi:hypothetical protein
MQYWNRDISFQNHWLSRGLIMPVINKEIHFSMKGKKYLTDAQSVMYRHSNFYYRYHIINIEIAWVR